MFISSANNTSHTWWPQLRFRLTIFYLVAALILVALSGAGHIRLLHEVTTQFTLQMWWQEYGLASLAGLCWLIIGGFLLITATEWTGAVEGMTLLPPAMLLLLNSHWGNLQQVDPPSMVFQLLWVPSFALLGAALIHLSLIYRPDTLGTAYTPKMAVDGLPYLPLLALLAYEWGSFVILGHVPAYINLIVSLGYAVLGGIISVCIGITSLVRISRYFPRKGIDDPIPPYIRYRIGNLLPFWIIGIGLVFCFGVLPIVLIGQTLLSLPEFYVSAAVYPFVLLPLIRSQRLIEHSDIILQQQEEILYKHQKIEEELRQTNRELKNDISFLLYADAHLRSILSQRIHDQPRQQALRIRSLLGHWQHKLRVETERDPAGKNAVQPLIDVFGKIRKISDELESDLRGLQLLVEDAYQRQSLGLKLHLEKLICEDLPTLHPESPLKVKADLWALDALSPDLEQTEEGSRIAEAISYAVTQALLNIYNHAGATYATVRTVNKSGTIEVYIIDDGHGFDINNISLEKTSLFKAQLKVQEADGVMVIRSISRPQAEHGTTVMLCIPLPSRGNT